MVTNIISEGYERITPQNSYTPVNGTMVKPRIWHARRAPPRPHAATKRQLLQAQLNLLVTPLLLVAACTNAGYKQPGQAAKYMYPELHASGLLSAKPQPGRPRFYNDTMMQLAFRVLTQQTPRRLYNTSQLFRRVVGNRQGRSAACFMRAFKDWLQRTYGTTVISTERADLNVNNELARARVKYCNEILELLKQRKLYLNDIVYMDETSVLEYAHPKGNTSPWLLCSASSYNLLITYVCSAC